MTIATLSAPEVRTYTEPLTLIELERGNGRFSELHGRAVPYDTWATINMFYRERHAQNSFKRSTDGAAKGLPLLLFHDSRSFPIGVSVGWEHRSDGMYGIWKLSESAEAQRAAWAAHDGELTGLSVGFQPDSAKSKWEHVKDWNPELGHDHMDRVTHHESRLVEVSMTPTPAYTDAEVTLVRTTVRRREVTRELDAWRKRVDSLRR